MWIAWVVIAGLAAHSAIGIAGFVRFARGRRRREARARAQISAHRGQLVDADGLVFDLGIATDALLDRHQLAGAEALLAGPRRTAHLQAIACDALDREAPGDLPPVAERDVIVPGLVAIACPRCGSRHEGPTLRVRREARDHRVRYELSCPRGHVVAVAQAWVGM